MPQKSKWVSTGQKVAIAVKSKDGKMKTIMKLTYVCAEKDELRVCKLDKNGKKKYVAFKEKKLKGGDNENVAISTPRLNTFVEKTKDLPAFVSCMQALGKIKNSDKMLKDEKAKEQFCLEKIPKN